MTPLRSPRDPVQTCSLCLHTKHAKVTTSPLLERGTEGIFLKTSPTLQMCRSLVFLFFVCFLLKNREGCVSCSCQNQINRILCHFWQNILKTKCTEGQPSLQHSTHQGYKWGEAREASPHWKTGESCLEFTKKKWIKPRFSCLVSTVNNVWRKPDMMMRFGFPSGSFSHLRTGSLELSQSERQVLGHLCHPQLFVHNSVSILALQAVPTTSWLGFHSDLNCQLWDHMSTGMWLSSELKMIKRNGQHIS